MARDRDNSQRDDIHSTVIRAGKRTYFFDVKSTRGNDLYLTITESKRKFQDDGGQSYEKHKIFLYKEDFEKFADGLYDTIEKIKDLRSGHNEFIDPANRFESSDNDVQMNDPGQMEEDLKEYTDVRFEDLDRDGMRD